MVQREHTKQLAWCLLTWKVVNKYYQLLSLLLCSFYSAESAMSVKKSNLGHFYLGSEAASPKT